ncbi:hypothetical protein F9C07_4135 [Aspergillus flavus]|uniref:Uncharacterized protein n=1 Tax=Aspergillus flavus (strain ATCC 200026 / FGSC A1120 / IAM 13836 / NRRL 3357 / JCM 12722 / SRRC 167) TaxID=332952 RepID=A0A7U2MVK4_ASPFN|nr:hypothetical protein F9C07_4135 [Aspergillus flavus]
MIHHRNHGKETDGLTPCRGLGEGTRMTIKACGFIASLQAWYRFRPPAPKLDDLSLSLSLCVYFLLAAILMSCSVYPRSSEKVNNRL